MALLSQCGVCVSIVDSTRLDSTMAVRQQLGADQGRVKERQVRLRTEDTGKARETQKANGFQQTKERREGQRSASVYVFVGREQGEHEW